MKRIGLVGLLLCVLFAGSASAHSSNVQFPGANAKPIAWYGSVWAAFTDAMAQKRPLVVYFYVRGGKYCAEFERTSLNDLRVQSLSQRGVFARLDCESDDAHNNVSTLIQQLGIKDYPTVVVLECYSDKLVERGRITGSVSPTDTYTQLDKLLRTPAK